MLERKIHKPDFLDSRLNILDEELPGSSIVKGALLEELPSEPIEPGKELKTKHFYIKEIPPAQELDYLPPPYQNAHQLREVARTIGRMKKDAREATTEELVEYYESNLENKKRLGLREDEDIRSKIDESLDLLKPETAITNTKKLYDLHRAWYNTEMPGFVIDKLFALGKDTEGNTRGYIIKKHVDSYDDADESAYRIDLGMFYHEAQTQGNPKGREAVLIDFVKQIKRSLQTVQQRATLRSDILKFIAVTKRVIAEEGWVIDFGAVHNGANIRIGPDGHLHMIDTDKVYPAKFRDQKDIAAINAEQILDALEYVADHLEDEEK